MIVDVESAPELTVLSVRHLPSSADLLAIGIDYGRAAWFVAGLVDARNHRDRVRLNLEGGVSCDLLAFDCFREDAMRDGFGLRSARHFYSDRVEDANAFAPVCDDETDPVPVIRVRFEPSADDAAIEPAA